MATLRAKVVEVEGGLQIHLMGPQAGKLNASLIESCANALISCGEKNACLSRGVSITGNCLQTLLQHNTRSKCFDKSFGLRIRAGR